MDIGIPKERRDLDLRVGLGPKSAGALVAAGHKVFVQAGAGAGSGFGDEEYTAVGARIAYSAEEIYKRARMVCKVNTPSLDEIEQLESGQVVCSFAHLAAASPQRFAKLREKKVTAVAYEMLREPSGHLPILRAMSQIAGRLVPQIAAALLQSPPGQGKLLSGIPGIPPAEVCILGAGEVGHNAARALAGLGAHVTVLDMAEHLAEMDRIFDVPGRLRLMYAYPDEIAKAAAFADVFVGAVLLPGERAPHVVTEQMVRSMRPGSAIIDVSIDQGGCVETSRPTTLRDPTFVKHGIVHYCVPNFTALVARTASRALSNVVRPFLLRLAAGPESLVRDAELRPAVPLYEGRVLDPRLGAAHGVQTESLAEGA
ncbi:MAG: alanine dehydrogenase [Deltaproteobacteria bacterium]|nr:alanine dehydrogenase [Deltaproteobacteria bacterium]